MNKLGLAGLLVLALAGCAKEKAPEEADYTTLPVAKYKLIRNEGKQLTISGLADYYHAKNVNGAFIYIKGPDSWGDAAVPKEYMAVIAVMGNDGSMDYMLGMLKSGNPEKKDILVAAEFEREDRSVDFTSDGKDTTITLDGWIKNSSSESGAGYERARNMFQEDLVKTRQDLKRKLPSDLYESLFEGRRLAN